MWSPTEKELEPGNAPASGFFPARWWKGAVSLCKTRRVDLDEALGEFDAAETTLRRLEAVWQRLAELVPEGIAFVGDSPEGIEYEDLRRAFRELVDGLPGIDDWTISEFPWALDEIAQSRFDARDIGEVEAITSVEQGVGAPGDAIREYRFRFNRARRSLVRERAQELMSEIAVLLTELQERVERDNEPIADVEWLKLVDRIREVERLMGSSMSRTGRWRDLTRHLAFAQGVDLHDIADHDWPSVLIDIQSALYGEYEPMPVQVRDLAELAATKPRGQVSTKLAWSVLSDEDFERLVFNIISDAPGYENPRWLTKTRAPDRGRDLSVDRVVSDSLSGVTRQRAIIQCRHSLSKSVTPTDVSNAIASMKLCEPPPVDVLIFATSGRFTGDAVTWIDKHNDERQRPVLEPWADSHLESLLSPRPYIVAEFGLRTRT